MDLISQSLSTTAAVVWELPKFISRAGSLEEFAIPEIAAKDVKIKYIYFNALSVLETTAMAEERTRLT